MTQTPLKASSILAYMPTYAPDTEAVEEELRPYQQQPNEAIARRINDSGFVSRCRPWVYMDCIDSVMNVRPDIDLVVADARSTDSIRAGLQRHQTLNRNYDLALYPEKMSQWVVLNDVLARHATPDTQFFVYTSSDVIWTMDWVEEAIREFDKDPSLQILFPCVNQGDPLLPVQVSPYPRDLPLIDPAGHMDCPGMLAARAPCLNAYAFIMRREFLDTYGGYPTVFRNCFSESFLYYMCEAMGGKMRLMPRGTCYHHSGVDAWSGEGGSYNYSAEKAAFERIMDDVQEARCAERPFMTAGYLKGLLYV